jgi:putative transposon-encoded protein|tara:strand:- start:601 stop:768 length:168 start_codon:yes stop_codon:yes gene_type:complete
MSLLKGNYKLKNQIKKKKLSQEEELEMKFEREAQKRLGGSMVYVSKKKINWDLKE